MALRWSFEDLKTRCFPVRRSIGRVMSISKYVVECLLFASEFSFIAQCSVDVFHFGS